MKKLSKLDKSIFKQEGIEAFLTLVTVLVVAVTIVAVTLVHNTGVEVEEEGQWT